MARFVKKGPQELAQLLDKKKAAVPGRALQLHQLNQQLTQLLPAELHGHYQLVMTEPGQVTMLVDTASLSMRMQFEKSTLLGKLQPLFPQLKALHIKIAPVLAKTPEPTTPPAPNPRRMSAYSASLLTELAENAPPALQKQLLRLSQHGSASTPEDDQ